MSVTIAVVEDDVRILDAIELLLEAEGWVVQTYTTGEAFLADFARNGAPQCIILDPHLPGMNGAEFAHAIIKANGRIQIPIIGLTARPSSPVAQQIIEAGARAMLTKPIAAEELITLIQSVIGASDGRDHDATLGSE